MLSPDATSVSAFAAPHCGDAENTNEQTHCNKNTLSRKNKKQKQKAGEFLLCHAYHVDQQLVELDYRITGMNTVMAARNGELLCSAQFNVCITRVRAYNTHKTGNIRQEVIITKNQNCHSRTKIAHSLVQASPQNNFLPNQKTDLPPGSLAMTIVISGLCFSFHLSISSVAA